MRKSENKNSSAVEAQAEAAKGVLSIYVFGPPEEKTWYMSIVKKVIVASSKSEAMKIYRSTEYFDKRAKIKAKFSLSNIGSGLIIL